MQNQITFASLFSGIGMVEMGLPSYIKPIFACEYETITAKVYEQVHGYKPEQDVHSLENLPYVTWLHMSPPCQNFSNNSTNTEQARDTRLADKIVSLLPEDTKIELITIENVRGYLSSHSYRTISNHLIEIGYTEQLFILNSHDFGVPQNRVRMFAVFSKNNRLIDIKKNKSKPGWGINLQHGSECKLNATQQKVLPKIQPDVFLIPRTSIGRRELPALTPDKPIGTFTRGIGSCTYPFTICRKGKFYNCTTRQVYDWVGVPVYYQGRLDFAVMNKICTRRQLNQMLGNGVTPTVIKAIAKAYFEANDSLNT